MENNLGDNIMAVGGGFTGALWSQINVIETGLIPVIVYAIVGAVVGYGVKKVLDKIFI